MNKITPQHQKLIILGSGPAGLTASIYAARANLKPLVITGKELGGQIIQTHLLENWPGIISISGGDFIYNLTKQIAKLSVKLVLEEIITVDFSIKPFKLFSSTHTYTSDSLIIATGCKPKILPLPILNNFIGQGVSFCATCDGYFYRGKTIVIVGGGNTALTEAIYLSNIVDKVYLVHYKDKFRAETFLINQLMNKVKEKKITLYYNYEIKNIYTTQYNGKEIIIGVGIQTNNPLLPKLIYLKISCIFIAIGTIPSTKIFHKYINLDKYGYIKINPKHKFYTQTNVKGIFAAGDVTNINYRYKQAITAAASGCMAAMDCVKYLCKNNK